MGGYVTLMSMLFIALVGYWFGLGAGMTAGFAFGILQMMIDPYIISVPQMLVDYVFAFMALGLPPTDSFWTAPYEKWTSKKAWEGDDFPKDHKWDINREILYWE